MTDDRESKMSREPAGDAALVVASNAVPNPKDLFKNVAEVAADLIRQAIYEGRIKPGERIKEEQFAEEFGISRTPIREALLTLQAERLLEAAPRRGVTVPRYSVDDVLDLYDIRALLEGHAASIVASQPNPALVAALNENQSVYKTLVDDGSARAVMDTNARFHRLILDACKSPILSAQLNYVSRLPLSYHLRYWDDVKNRQATTEQHQALITAVAEQEPDVAERIMRDHVLYARDVVIKNLESKRSQTDDDSPTE